MNDVEKYRTAIARIGCLMMLIFGGCITGIIVALTVKLITWMFGM